MDLKLSEEERLVRETAAQFVTRELMSQEGSFFKQKEPFLPPGDPPRRDLDADIRKSLLEKAKRIGLWALDLPEEVGGSRMGQVARVLIYREFGGTALPFEPPSIPVVVTGSPYARRLTSGELSLSLAFDEVHKTGGLSEIRTSYRRSPKGYELSSDGMDVINPGSDLYLLPAKEQGSGEVGLFLLERSAPGVSVAGETDLTTDQTVGTFTLRECRVGSDQLVGDAHDVQRLVATEQLRLAAR